MSACRSDRRTSVVRSPKSCRQGRPRLIMRVASRISFSLNPRVGGYNNNISPSCYHLCDKESCSILATHCNTTQADDLCMHPILRSRRRADFISHT